MKLLSYSLAVLAFLWVAQTSRADEKRFDDAQRFLFHSILEGLYEDGVSTEDVDRILLKREKEDYFHFIHACPVCMGSVWAFEAYRHRPKNFHCVKVAGSTFGWGLKKKLREDLHGEDVEKRLAVINTLIGRWVTERMDRLRLTEEERAKLVDTLEGKRELGLARLKELRNQSNNGEGAPISIFAPAYAGRNQLECGICRAAVGKPMGFVGGKKEAAEQEGEKKGGEE
ncbi:MAG: hypothetical protein ACON38_08475 [Akkermansiaceae bacterium]